jgi:uncharacterized membrane protein
MRGFGAMADDLESPANTDEMPFVAPCRQLSATAPWYWLSEGFEDLRKAALQSLTYGMFMAVLIMFVLVMAWQYGSAWVMFSMLCGFVFVAPLSCVGIYAISAQLERNQKVSMRRSLRAVFRRYLGTLLVYALVLLIIFLLWARAASVVSIFLPDTTDPSFSELSTYIIVWMLVGGLFVGVTFSASVFALPMIMHRNVDAITAVLTSVNAVLHNKLAMLVWVFLILLGFLIGVATAGFGLVFFLPAVGHGVWHGYLDTIDASQFPRHEVGITAIPRLDNEPPPPIHSLEDD